MAKIEGIEGLRHAEEIIQAADAILFSRGNLGVCLDAEKVWKE
jgi:pyruvate kinase